jgi:predicted membrane protein
MQQRPTVTPGLVFGMLVLAAGVVLLLDRQGIINASYAFPFFLPAVLLAIGIFKLVESSTNPSRVWGAVLTAAGILLVLDHLGYTRVSFEALWPLALIGFGLLMVWRAVGGSAGAHAKPMSVLNEWTAFGGGQLQSDAQDFQGGEVFAIFGGYDIDLRQASIADQQAVIHANAIFGGVEIKVPRSWSVSVHGLPLLGGYTDETQHSGSEGGATAKQLVVRGFAMFGGVSVKN